MDMVLLSRNNLEFLLKNFKNIITDEIKNLEIYTTTNKKLIISDIINTSGTGNKLLSNNGLYKDYNSKNINDLILKTDTVYNNVFKIENKVSHANKLEEKFSKINTIKKDGLGNKFLNDQGEYIEINDKPISDEEIKSLIDEIIGGI